MHNINDRPSTEVKEQLDGLVEELPFHDRIPRRSGDVAFDHSWEIRAFSIATAMHADGAFDWKEFQAQLIASIKEWEHNHADPGGWNYYERWIEALEELMRGKGLVSAEELEHRAAEIMALPPNANHHHAVREPVAVVPGSGGASA